MANWADIPSDILLRIVSRSSFLNEIIVTSAVCNAVCKSWRSTIASLGKPSFPPKVPWLMLAEANKRGDATSKEASLGKPSCPPKVPWLRPAEAIKWGDATSKEEIDHARSFFNLSDTKIYKLNLPEAAGRKCFGTSFGWLLTIGTDLRIKLIHPFSKCQIVLPPQSTFKRQYMEYSDDDEPEWIRNIWLRDIFIHKAVTSTNPWNSEAHDYDNNCVIMTIYGEYRILAFARLGDKAWIDVETPSRAYDDIVYYKGKFYAVDCHGVVFVCDIDDDQNPKAIAIAPAPKGTKDFIKKYLVESSGELLLISRIYEERQADKPYDDSDPKEDDEFEVEDSEEGSDEESSHNDRNVTKEFTVLKLQQQKGSKGKYKYKWVEVESLGDQALFVGDGASFSLSASNSNGCKANCIYFTDDYLETYFQTDNGGGDDMGVFSLEDRTIKPHYTGQSFSHFSTPLWYI